MFLVETINKKKSLYTDFFDKKDLAFDRKNLASIDQAAKMPDRSKDIKMPHIRHICLESKHTTSSQSRLGIQSIQCRFKLIEFNDGKRGQAGEQVDKENTMAYIADISIEQNNNYLLFKNNVEYS